MGNKGKQGSSSSQSSNSYSNSYSSSRTDSRSYQNTDSRSYQNTDARSYQNVDSRDMSTNVNNVDNRNISDTALNCGVSPSDVENYTNDESININQDNSQNIIVSGDGNTLSNITQKMNLTSYGPSVKKCMQDAVTKMATKNKTDLSSKKENTDKTSNVGSNSSESASTNANKSTSDNTTGQSSSNDQSTKQSNDQSSSMKQTAGSGGSEILILIVIILILLYTLNEKLFNMLKNEFVTNLNLQIILSIYLVFFNVL
jgi:hypothetical protein